MSDLPEFNALCDTRYGKMLVNKHDVYVGGSILYQGEFSEHEADLFRRLITVGGVVVEAGANIGALSIPIAQHIGEEGRLFAYEPQRLAFQLLNANVALNSLTNVVTRQVALGASRGQIAVPYLDPRATNNVGGLDLRQTYDGAPTEQVPILPLDDYPLRRCDFLKADVEGFEFGVLIGARELIATHKPVLYLEWDRADQRPQVLDLLSVYGYPLHRIFLHRPPLYNENNFNGKVGSIFVADGKEVVSINLLCFHSSLEEIPDLAGIPYLEPLLTALQSGQQQEAAA